MQRSLSATGKIDLCKTKESLKIDHVPQGVFFAVAPLSLLFRLWPETPVTVLHANRQIWLNSTLSKMLIFYYLIHICMKVAQCLITRVFVLCKRKDFLLQNFETYWFNLLASHRDKRHYPWWHAERKKLQVAERMQINTQQTVCISKTLKKDLESLHGKWKVGEFSADCRKCREKRIKRVVSWTKVTGNSENHSMCWR